LRRLFIREITRPIFDVDQYRVRYTPAGGGQARDSAHDAENEKEKKDQDKKARHFHPGI
jgi:hypothetical protein